MTGASAPTTRGTARQRWHLGYLAAAVVFAIGMAGTTLPTPLYGLYREELGFSELMVTVIFASYAVGVIATLLLVGNHSDRVGVGPSCGRPWGSPPPARSASCSRADCRSCSPAGCSRASRPGC